MLVIDVIFIFISLINIRTEQKIYLHEKKFKQEIFIVLYHRKKFQFELNEVVQTYFSLEI